MECKNDEAQAATPSTPLATQVGGTHYSVLPIQPIEFITKNGLDFLEGNVIKYVSRYKRKDGLKDLEKARHYLDLLISRESGR